MIRAAFTAGPILAILLLAGCGGGSGTLGPPARPGQVVTGFTERLPDRPGFRLFLRNNTDSHVTITSVTIYECVNMAVWCDTREMDLVLAPRELRRLLAVEPEDRTRRSSYRWRWTHERGVIPRVRGGDRSAPDPIVLEDGEERQVLLDPRGRFVNLVLPPDRVSELQEGSWSAAQLQEITRTLYRFFEDRFDMVLIALADADEAESSAGRTYRTATVADGLGVSTRDATADYGSEGRLRSVAMLSSHARLDASLSLHEIAHTWGQYILDTGMPGHWGFSGVGGMLGGWEPDQLERVRPGLWRAPDPESPSPFGLSGPRSVLRGYAPIELYLMGLIPADSVPPVPVAADGDWHDVQEGTFRASAIDTVRIEELVAEHGPRTPAWPDAPTRFRAAYVVVSSAPLADSTRTRIDEDVADFARPGPREIRWYPNFWEATGGRARLDMDGLDEAMRSSAVEPEGHPPG